MPVPSFQRFDSDAFVLVRARNLPHWTQEGCTYFLTFRLADSLPKKLLGRWNQERSIWLRMKPPPWNVETEKEYHSRFTARIERWLDQGHGSCALRAHQIREPIIEALRFYDNERYLLDSFVIMPNHAHVVVRPLQVPLSQVLHSWKSFSGLRINRLLGRTGRFWMDESFDRIVRSEGQLFAIREYIARNPLVAKLGLDEYSHYQWA
jgi:putative transposase